MLDGIPCVVILSDEMTLRLALFCARRNRNVDEVLSYYIQHELEKVGALDDRRVCVLWEHIDSHELRVEVVKDMKSRLSPYSADGDDGGVREY